MMAYPTEPWTFEPYEMYPEGVWEIYDPNLARVIAIFYDGDSADEYLAWVNKRQAKKKKKKG